MLTCSIQARDKSFLLTIKQQLIRVSIVDRTETVLVTCFIFWDPSKAPWASPTISNRVTKYTETHV